MSIISGSVFQISPLPMRMTHPRRFVKQKKNVKCVNFSPGLNDHIIIYKTSLWATFVFSVLPTPPLLPGIRMRSRPRRVQKCTLGYFFDNFKNYLKHFRTFMLSFWKNSFLFKKKKQKKEKTLLVPQVGVAE